MKIYDPQSFGEEVLPKIITSGELHVLFATYNCVAGGYDGVVETSKEGLRITVLNGSLEYSGSIDDLLLGGMTAADIMVREAQDAQFVVEKCFQDAKHILREDRILVFIYIGLTAAKESISFAKKVHSEFPQATIVFLSCTCQKERKDEMFARLMRDGIFSYGVMTEQCGGQSDMRDILETIIFTWPV